MTQLRSSGSTRLETHISHFFASERWDDLSVYLGHLSHSDFRSVSSLLSDTFLPQLTDTSYWEAFTKIVPLNPKAYLVTFLKAAVILRKNEKLSLDNPLFIEYTQGLVRENRSIDIGKTIELLLPTSSSPEEASAFINLFALPSTDKMKALYRAHTTASYYLLFEELRRSEHDTSIIKSYISLLIKRKERIDYNLAAILSKYFGIAIPGITFSLRIEDFKLSYIATSYETFSKVLHSI